MLSCQLPSYVKEKLGTMEALYACLKTPSKEGYEKEYFWISGVALVFVGFVGLIGNILCLFVLFRKEFRKKTFYNLLITMACFDTLFIISYGIKISYQSMACRENYIYEVGHIAYPLLNVGLCGSIYSTVAVSLERYFTLCHPRFALSKNLWIYITFVLGITFSYNLPRFFEYHYFISNGTLHSEKNEWVKYETYQNIYHHWVALFVENIIPIV